MNMNFDERLKQAISVDDASIDESRFIEKLHDTQHQLAIKRARLNSSLATAAFLMVFGWASFSQLDNGIYEYVYDGLYTFEDDYDYYSEFDSLEYDLYLADLALYLLDEDDIWEVMEFFEEVEYDFEINNKEINL
ncbi:MAG: hypothetical protein QF439_03140 [Candidatus Marinimicrobia bacterium]|jgi:hypothetical protein|nr:hypothetical protein [Candidatus Neomarinimicrobiota bacterium]HJL75176.1 hypothetical protein [Candidatus Neomarinimicrobiota bacterium]|tara:strand:+ start:1918 stop:2322 length:405 start_codon:yes stop_codon:yes gene_type:complete